MALNVRVTHRTDTRGTVRDEFRNLYAIKALSSAAKAGIPAELLHPSGWNGDEDDLTGFYAEQIYRLGEVRWTKPGCLDEIQAILNWMLTVCQRFGADPQLAIPYDMARFYRQLHDGRERRAAVEQDGSLPLSQDIRWPPAW